MEDDEPKPFAQSREKDKDGTESQTRRRSWPSWLRSKLLTIRNIERRGIVPVPLEERTNRKTYSIFTLWFTMDANLLPIVTGMTATLSYGLSLLAASLVILFLTLLCTIPVAYLATIGPKTGMRQMIQARYSFGFYGVSVPVILNMATQTGFCIIDAVVGGQTLSAVAGGRLTPTVGIVIIAVLGMVVAFCGFRVLHFYERWAWAPALLVIIVATGCGGSHLHEQVAVKSVEATSVISFAALTAGFLIPWAALASDFVTYMDPATPKFKIFTYTYTGIALPIIPLMILGAAIGGAAPNVPSWLAGYNTDSVGGVMAAMLQPAGGFGKFLVVVLSFSILGNLAGTMYSITLNFQLLTPWLVRVPRFVFAVVITAITIPIAIFAAKKFIVSLENFIGIIGYWSAAYVAVVIIEHAWFRKSDYETYDPASWDKPKRLPTGLAALGASVLSFGLVIPSMAQVWYTGRIAKHTGDIGFEMAFAVTALLYVPFRYLEIRLLGRL